MAGKFVGEVSMIYNGKLKLFLTLEIILYNTKIVCGVEGVSRCCNYQASIFNLQSLIVVLEIIKLYYKKKRLINGAITCCLY